MYLHGGGWVLGSKNTRPLLRDVVSATGVASCSSATRRRPRRVATSLEQCYAATRYVAEHEQELQLDSGRLAVMGDSVGGNLTAAISLRHPEKAQ